jgi:methyl-accepting chemotaxis protein
MWTFGRRIAAGFALAFVLMLVIGGTAYRGLSSLTNTSYKVAHTHEVLEHCADLMQAMTDAETGQRGFVITGEESYLGPYYSGGQSVPRVVKDLRELLNGNRAQLERLDRVEQLANAKLTELKRVIDTRKSSGAQAAVAIVSAGIGKQYMDQTREVLGEMEREERQELRQRAQEVDSAQMGAKATLLYGTILCILLITAVGVVMTRSLSGQIGSAVRHVQSSSAELQSAANQQATGAKESATAMTEITTTISELLATSRQIAESAQRVAHVADETASAAHAGDTTARRTHDSVNAVKRQVDLIVAHMLDLGKKSQQIGGILEIINELSEQTNILAINATIEASGAGEAGKRFAVVADEIRKLADRVSGSTKEIRALIEEIRAAVNTTVMATEGGSKAVDLGARQFVEVTAALKQITDLLGTTTAAAREIELSTKQQSTAVEQVNIAVANVASATKESEVNSAQTLQTAGKLAGLSRELIRMIQAESRA